MSLPAYYSAPKIKEKFDERVVAMATASMAKALDKEATSNGETRSDVVRRALESYYQPRHVAVDLANIATDSFRAPLLSRVPCGPLKEAVDNGETFTISGPVADELESRDGDFWVRAEGESLKASGVQDGFLVQMRPLDGRPPKRGEIALIQFFDEDGGVYLATMKHWFGQTDFRDGDDNAFEGPEGYEARAVAVARGVIGRL